MFGLAVAFGCLVGFALGLTGGGGGIFAVPLLVYGLAIAPRQAVAISLAAVGGTALFGVLPRIYRGEVEVRTGLLFAVAGMVGAPIGSYFSTLLDENILLILFAILMLVVAQRMWAKAKDPGIPSGVCSTESDANLDRSACQRDADGTLRLTSRCARLLAVVGLITGILSGLFGVGGGFVIVPALVLFSGMAIHAAVATSLFVIVLIAVSGVGSQLLEGSELPWETTAQFIAGGFVGMWLGGLLSKRLKGPTLQRVFAIATIMVAGFVIFRTAML